MATFVCADDATLDLAREGRADELLERAPRGRHDLVVASRRSLPDGTVAMRLIEAAHVSVAVVP